MSLFKLEKDSPEIKSLKIVCLLVSLYVVVSMISNVTSLRVIILAGLSMDAGALFYPLSFTLRDMIHKKAGKNIAIFAILLTAGINLAMFLCFYLVAILPADLAVGPQTEFGTVLMPGLRIVAASIIAMILAEFIDTAIYSAIKQRLGEKMQWARVAVSNAVSIPIDSILFIGIAFYGLLPTEVLVAMLLSNILIKYFVSLWSIGSIYWIKEDKN